MDGDRGQVWTGIGGRVKGDGVRVEEDGGQGGRG